MHRIAWLLVFASALGSCRARAQEVSPATQPSNGQAALAERFCQMAQNTLRVQHILPSTWEQTAALLEAAHRLNPDEPRYIRLLADARLQLKDIDGALEALYRYLDVLPNDRVVQSQVIDLYLTTMQTADAKLRYLNDLVGELRLADELRAHAAVHAARLMLEQGQVQAAWDMLGRALRLNPLSLPALRLRLDMMDERAPVYERVTLLLAMLRANPAQPQVMGALASELASVGLLEQSLQWYSQGVTDAMRMGMPLSETFVQGYATVLFLADQLKTAEALLKQLLERQGDSFDGRLMAMLVAKNMGETESFEEHRREALNVVANRLATIQHALGDAGATTRPAGSTGPVALPDLTVGVKLIEDSGDARAWEAYAAALLDLAWVGLYFDGKPEDATTAAAMQALRELLPAEHLTLRRLEGWSHLTAGRVEEAKAALSEIAADDPLAALGLIKLAELAGERESADAQARRLLAQNPSGLLAAVLADATSRRIKVAPLPAADTIRAELQKFPRRWLRILEQPSEFYIVRAEPLSVSHEFNEPMLARITLHNVSEFDLTVGSEGVLRPDLWIDAELRGLVQQSFSGIAYDRLTGEIVLRSRQSMSQVVRIDQGNLGQFLSVNPTISIQVFGRVLTNPTMTPSGITAGPAGYRVQFARLMERKSYPLNSEEAKRKLYEDLQGGSDSEKLATLELLTIYVKMFESAQNKEQAKPLAMEFTDVIAKHVWDGSLEVRTWAAYLTLILTAPERRGPLLRSAMSGDWPQRLIAAVAVQAVPAQLQTALLETLQGDPDPVVQGYAETITAAAAAAVTQPAPAATDVPQAPGLPAVPPADPLSPLGPATLPTTMPDLLLPALTPPASDAGAP